MKYLAATTTMLLVSLNTSASNVTVPNIFVPSQPALASEVNDNFSAVADAINDNHSRIEVLEGGPTVVVDCDADGPDADALPDTFALQDAIDSTASPGRISVSGSCDPLTISSLSNISITGTATTGFVVIENADNIHFDGLTIQGTLTLNSANKVTIDGTVQGGVTLNNSRAVIINDQLQTSQANCSLDANALQTTIDGIKTGGNISVSGTCNPVTITHSNISITGPATIAGSGPDGQALLVKGATNIALDNLTINGQGAAEYSLEFLFSASGSLNDVSIINSTEIGLGIAASSSVLLLGGNNIADGMEVEGSTVYVSGNNTLDSLSISGALFQQGDGQMTVNGKIEVHKSSAFSADDFTSTGNIFVENASSFHGVSTANLNNIYLDQGGVADIEAPNIALMDLINQSNAKITGNITNNLSLSDSSANLTGSLSGNVNAQDFSFVRYSTTGLPASVSNGCTHSHVIDSNGTDYCSDDDGDGVPLMTDSCPLQGGSVDATGCP